MPHQVLPDAINVLADHRIVDDARAHLDFLGELAAERDLAIDGVEVDAVADVALADEGDVVLGRHGAVNGDAVLLDRRLRTGGGGFGIVGISLAGSFDFGSSAQVMRVR